MTDEALAVLRHYNLPAIPSRADFIKIVEAESGQASVPHAFAGEFYDTFMVPAPSVFDRMVRGDSPSKKPEPPETASVVPW